MKTKIRTALLLLLSILLLLSLICCAEKSENVMEYKKSAVTSNMYQYWMSGYKAMFLYTYGADMQNAAAFWSEEIDDGVTTESFFTSIVDQSVMKKLVCLSLFEENNLKLNDATRISVKETVDRLVSDLADGKKSEFNRLYAEYGVNYDILIDIYLAEAKIEMLRDFFYGEYGVEQLTSSQKEEYFSENYARMNQIFIHTKDKLVKGSDGKYIIEGDKYKSEPLSESEKAEKQAKILEVEQKIAEGQDFDTLLQNYNEDEAASVYKDGLYFTPQTEYIDEVISALFGLEIGESCRVESEFGTHFIKREPLIKGAYSDKENADFFGSFDTDVIDFFFDEKLSELIPDVRVNQEAKEKIKASEIEENWNF